MLGWERLIVRVPKRVARQIVGVIREWKVAAWIEVSAGRVEMAGGAITGCPRDASSLEQGWRDQAGFAWKFSGRCV
jgi:hypothetical protein